MQSLNHGFSLISFRFLSLSPLSFSKKNNKKVTGDYLQGPNNFDIGGTSLLVWSLGLAPFKVFYFNILFSSFFPSFSKYFLSFPAFQLFFPQDVFWTEGRQPGNEWNITEQNPRMNTIISSLSAGPIGFGDGKFSSRFFSPPLFPPFFSLHESFRG